MKRFFTFLALCFAACTLHSDIIIIHGSFASESKWHRPGGKFYEAVKTYVAREGESIQHFIWSGGFTEQSIIEAAGHLADIILSTSQPLSIFSHSNGGNVTAYATQLIAALSNYEPKRFCKPETLPEPLIKPFGTKKTLPGLDAITHKIAHVLNTLNAHHNNKVPRTRQDHRIEHLVLMGTPIKTPIFDFDMSVTHYLYNLYSPADIVQPFAGKQTVPPHERRANVWIKIAIPELEDTTYLPCHKHIRNELIAHYFHDIIGHLHASNDYETVLSGGLTLFPDQSPSFEVGAPTPAASPLSSEENSDFDSSDEDEEDDDWESDWE